MNVNFVKNSYLKLSEGGKATLSETCADFLHFLESFADYENQSLIHLWLFEDPIQDPLQIRAGTFRPFFTKAFFFQTVTAYYTSAKELRMMQFRLFFKSYL